MSAVSRSPMPGSMTSPVPSPCVDVCRMNEGRGVCEGCLRTLDEIAAWSRLDDSGKRRIWALLHERRAALEGAANAAKTANAEPKP